VATGKEQAWEPFLTRNTPTLDFTRELARRKQIESRGELF
jgi:hypothetical protein